MGEHAPFGPLQGVRVLGLCQAIAGPFACSMLGDMGADVIAVENPKGRDTSRPNAAAPGWGTVMDRRNSRSLCIDVRSSQGRSAFDKLVATADMLVDGFRGGQLARWGLSDETLWQLNPRLVIVHISGYGQTGVPDYVTRASFDGIGQAYSGFMEMNGYADRPPLPAFPQVSDYYAGFMALTGGLAALYRAQATGQGESVDVAQFEAMLRCSGFYVMSYLNTGALPQRNAAMNAGVGTYTCGDGVNLFLQSLGVGVLRNLCDVLDIPYPTKDFPEGIVGARKGTRAAAVLEEQLAAFLGSRSAQEAEEALSAAGVPASRVYTFAMGEADPHYQARGIFTEWRNAHDDGTTRGVAVVPRLTRNPGRINRGMPCVGQHNEEILTELGYAPQEIARWYEAGILKKETGPKG